MDIDLHRQSSMSSQLFNKIIFTKFYKHAMFAIPITWRRAMNPAPSGKQRLEKYTRSIRVSREIAEKIDSFPWGTAGPEIDRALRVQWKIKSKSAASK
jgi:hypothetical protein